MEDQIEIFVQGPGITRVALVKVPSHARVGDLVEVAKTKGLRLDDQPSARVWLESAEEPLNAGVSLQDAGIQSRSRIHIHTCPRIRVTVNFNGKAEEHPFSPSATIGAVKQWADKKFGLSAIDATEYALQICGTKDYPADDIEVGSLAQPGECRACFDLVSIQRVEG